MAKIIKGTTPKSKMFVAQKSNVSPKGIMTGSGQQLTRDSKGVLSSTRGKNFAGQSNESMRNDRKVAAGTGSGNYPGNVAPRVGGSMPKPAGKVVKYGNSSAINKKNVGKLRKMK